MVRLIQCHSTALCLTQICVYRRYNFHALGYKQLLCFLFFNPLPFKFLVDPPSRLPAWACSLSSSRVPTHSTPWLQPTGPPYIAQTPSSPYFSRCIVDLLVPPMRPSHHAPYATPKAALSLWIPLTKKLDYAYLHLFNKDQSHPNFTHRLILTGINSMSHNLYAQFIHQRFVHTSHQSILQMDKLGIYTGLPNSIPKLSYPCRAYIIAKVPRLPLTPMFPHNTLIREIAFIYT